jgi:hypothetical protein
MTRRNRDAAYQRRLQERIDRLPVDAEYAELRARAALTYDWRRTAAELARVEFDPSWGDALLAETVGLTAKRVGDVEAWT